MNQTGVGEHMQKVVFGLLIANKVALVVILKWYMNRMRGAAFVDESPYAALPGGGSEKGGVDADFI